MRWWHKWSYLCNISEWEMRLHKPVTDSLVVKFWTRLNGLVRGDLWWWISTLSEQCSHLGWLVPKIGQDKRKVAGWGRLALWITVMILTLWMSVVFWCNNGWGGRLVGCEGRAAHPSSTPSIRKAFHLSYYPLSEIKIQLNPLSANNVKTHWHWEGLWHCYFPFICVFIPYT